MSIEKKACDAYQSNKKLAPKYQVGDSMWMDWYTKGYRQAEIDIRSLSERQLDEKMFEYIKRDTPDIKLKLAQYSLTVTSAMALDAHSDETTLSSEFTHNGIRYEAKMVITQREI